MKKHQNIAKILGQRGGKLRAKKLSAQRRREIAALGGLKRAESLRISKAIIENFRYAEVMGLFFKKPKVKQVSSCKTRLPGIYLK